MEWSEVVQKPLPGASPSIAIFSGTVEVELQCIGTEVSVCSDTHDFQLYSIPRWEMEVRFFVTTLQLA